MKNLSQSLFFISFEVLQVAAKSILNEVNSIPGLIYDVFNWTTPEQAAINWFPGQYW